MADSSNTPPAIAIAMANRLSTILVITLSKRLDSPY